MDTYMDTLQKSTKSKWGLSFICLDLLVPFPCTVCIKFPGLFYQELAIFQSYTISTRSDIVLNHHTLQHVLVQGYTSNPSIPSSFIPDMLTLALPVFGYHTWATRRLIMPEHCSNYSGCSNYQLTGEHWSDCSTHVILSYRSCAAVILPVLNPHSPIIPTGTNGFETTLPFSRHVQVPKRVFHSWDKFSHTIPGARNIWMDGNPSKWGDCDSTKVIPSVDYTNRALPSCGGRQEHAFSWWPTGIHSYRETNFRRDLPYNKWQALRCIICLVSIDLVLDF